jgi:hypothetical protein
MATGFAPPRGTASTVLAKGRPVVRSARRCLMTLERCVEKALPMARPLMLSKRNRRGMVLNVRVVVRTSGRPLTTA